MKFFPGHLQTNKPYRNLRIFPRLPLFLPSAPDAYLPPPFITMNVHLERSKRVYVIIHTAGVYIWLCMCSGRRYANNSSSNRCLRNTRIHLLTGLSCLVGMIWVTPKVLSCFDWIKLSHMMLQLAVSISPSYASISIRTCEMCGFSLSVWLNCSNYNQLHSQSVLHRHCLPFTKGNVLVQCKNCKKVNNYAWMVHETLFIHSNTLATYKRA